MCSDVLVSSTSMYIHLDRVSACTQSWFMVRKKCLLNDSYSSFYIPIDVNAFDIVNYKSADYFEQTIHFTKPTRNLDVTLCNSDGEVYTSSDWEFVIKKCECS